MTHISFKVQSNENGMVRIVCATTYVSVYFLKLKRKREKNIAHETRPMPLLLDSKIRIVIIYVFILLNQNDVMTIDIERKEMMMRWFDVWHMYDTFQFSLFMTYKLRTYSDIVYDSITLNFISKDVSIIDNDDTTSTNFISMQKLFGNNNTNKNKLKINRNCGRVRVRPACVQCAHWKKRKTEKKNKTKYERNK